MIGELMGLLSKAKPGSQGNIGIMPLEETSPELLEGPDVLVPPVPMPPEPELPRPEPATPDEGTFDVPPSSPVELDPVEEHAANPKIAKPNGKPAKKIVFFMKASLSTYEGGGEEEKWLTSTSATLGMITPSKSMC